MKLKELDIINEDEDYVYVKAGAGENWHQFVMYCIDTILEELKIFH